MPIISEVPIYWPALNPEKGFMWKGNPPERWKVTLLFENKDLKKDLEKDGFKINPQEDESGKILYKTTLAQRVYKRGQNGEEEDRENKNKPITVIAGDGTPIDPDTIGNGSIANVSYRTWKGSTGDTYRVLVGVQVVKHIVRDPDPDNTAFDLGASYEVVSDLDDNIPF